ncbi:MAG: hypothetical protein AMJ53_09840 [Gammaproteobacteria bacterium SG8_11]|nr:MAG: hypothetical protein AMJ53_09840 [Gammaproteobacteria bacterium SG8_11]
MWRGLRAERVTLQLTALSDTVNLFLVATPLQYLGAEVILKNYEAGKRNHLFYVRPDISSVINNALWTDVQFLPWPKKFPKKGLFGKMRRIRENLLTVNKVCENASDIRLHVWMLRSEATNYHVNALRKAFPESHLSVRIIPDGTLGLFRRELQWYEKLGLRLRKLRRIIYPSLNYYLFSGDRIGTDAPIVDRVYCLSGIPHEFDGSKTCELPSLVEADFKKDKHTKRALVLSQPFFQLGKCSKAELEKVTAGIRAYLVSQHMDLIEYKQHPYDRIKEFYNPDYKELTISEPLEKYLGKHFYHLVIGVDSAALFLAKAIYGNQSKIVSFGKNVMHSSHGLMSPRKAQKRSKAIQALREQMEKSDIEQIDCNM